MHKQNNFNGNDQCIVSVCEYPKLHISFCKHIYLVYAGLPNRIINVLNIKGIDIYGSGLRQDLQLLSAGSPCQVRYQKQKRYIKICV